MLRCIIKENLKSVLYKYCNGFGFGSGMGTAFYLLNYHNNNINQHLMKKKI